MSTPVIHTNKLRIGSSNAYTGITVGTSPVYRVKIGSDVKYDRKDYDFSVSSGRMYIPVGGGNMYSSIAAKVTSTYTGYNGNDEKVTNGSASWAASQTYWSSNAQSTSQKTGSITVTQDSSNLSGTIYWTQYADSYETLTAITSITLTLNTPSTIPAGGGSVNSTTYSVKANGYTYRHWSSGGDTNISSGSWNVTPDNILWTGVTAGSKGTSASTQTNAGTLYGKAYYGSYTSTASATVYQDANSAGSPSWTSITATAGEYPTDLPASGGTASTMSSSNISVTAAGYVPYTSGSKAPTSTTVSSSQVTVSAGTPVVASSKGTTPSSRSYVGTLYLKAQWNGLNSNQMGVSIYQELNKIESYNWTTLAFSLSTPSTIPASGGSVNSTTYSDVHLEGTATYTSKASGAATSSVTITNTEWGHSSSPSGTVTWGSGVSAGSRGTTTGYSQTVGYLWLRATGGTKTGSSYVEVTQEANRRSTSPTYTGLTVTLSTPAQIPASGGTVSTTTYTAKRSGYYTYTSGAQSSTTANTTNTLSAVTTQSVTARTKGIEPSPVTNAGTLIMVIYERYTSYYGSGSVDVKQAANAVVSSGTSTESGDTFVSSSLTTSNYSVTLNKSSVSFTSGSGSTNITVTAVHDATITYNYTHTARTVTSTTYTSGESDKTYGPVSTTPKTVTDEETRIPDTPIITNNNNWITATTTQIKVSKQADNAPARNGTVTYTNSTASATLTVSQAAGAVVYVIQFSNGETSMTIDLGDGEEFTDTIYFSGGNVTWTASASSIYSTRFELSPMSGTTGAGYADFTLLCKTKNTARITITFTMGSGINAKKAYLYLEPTGY